MLINQIKEANLQALKDHDQPKRTILSVVLTKIKNLEIELNAKGLFLTDNDVIVVLQKVLKEATEEKTGYEKVANQTMVLNLEKQLSVIQAYLPKMLDENEIRAIIKKIDDPSIPAIMKYFKENYQGKVDLSLVSKIAKEQS